MAELYLQGFFFMFLLSFFNLAKFLMTTFQYYTNARLAFDADLEANSDYCLSFWYHISGFDAGKLQLFYTQTTTSGQPDWSRDGNYSDHWHQGEIRLSATGLRRKMTFSFVAQRGSKQMSHISLDDISLQKGHCLGMSTFMTILQFAS